MDRITQKTWKELGIDIPRILVPQPDADWTAWAVLACDQYSSQPEYWREVGQITEGMPSTFHFVLPEVWLHAEDRDARIASAHDNMREALKSGMLRELPPGGVLVKRQVGDAVRTGLLINLDLECYSYAADAKTLIRTTEGTIEERIPLRLRMREDAEIELPHILVLIDDPGHTAIEPLDRRRGDFETLYDFELMLGGGHIAGHFVPEESLAGFQTALSALYDESVARYGDALLYAVGDGNHSLASALAHWNAVKASLSPEEAACHPARYALVEIVNIHDPGIAFAPIHRVFFGLAADDAAALKKRLATLAEAGTPSIAALQDALDAFLLETPNARVDFIHGVEAARRLGAATDRMCILLESIDKSTFFQCIAQDGPLPRKSFSLGEADEKRFYIEARRIR